MESSETDSPAIGAISVALAAGQTAEASQRAQSEIRRILAARDDPSWFATASRFGNFLTEVGLVGLGVEMSLEVRRRAEVLRSTGGETETAVWIASLSNLASALMRAERPDDALEVLTPEADHVRSVGAPTAGNFFYMLGVVLAEMSDIDAAREAYREARAIFEDSGDDFDVAYVDRGFAASLSRTGRAAEAVIIFRRAAEIFAGLGRDDEVRRTHVGLIAALSSAEQVVSAADLATFEDDLELMGQTDSQAMALNLAIIAQRQGDLETAERLFVRAAALSNGFGVARARVDQSHAVLLRRRGDLHGALELNQRSTVVFEEEGLWREAAQGRNNEALLLLEMAETAEPRTAEDLRALAAEASLRAIESLDGLRHSLSSPTDRRNLMETRYPHVFAVALQATTAAGMEGAAAAVVERARVQPVLRDDHATGYVEPAPLAATPDGITIGGRGDRVVLSDLAEDLAGPHAVWCGWWDSASRVVRSTVWSGTGVSEVDTCETAWNEVDALSLAMPNVLDLDRIAADGDSLMSGVVALWRAASGPLLDDPDLAELLAEALPHRVRTRVLGHRPLAQILDGDADALLWPVTELLLPISVREALLEADDPLGLVVAPTRRLGRVPWAALPLSDPARSTPPLLVEHATVCVGLPATLMAGRPSPAAETGPGALVVADALGDLRHVARIRVPDADILGSAATGHANRLAVEQALNRRPSLLVLATHVVPGTLDDPASAALLFRASHEGESRPDHVTVRDLATFRIPPTCIVIGCDGAGAATGLEWTGVATGLVWSGARSVVTSTSVVLDDQVSVSNDEELIADVRSQGGLHGLHQWQRRLAHEHRMPGQSKRSAPYRWSGFVCLVTRAGRDGFKPADVQH